MDKPRHSFGLIGIITLVMASMIISCGRRSALSQFEVGNIYSGTVAGTEYVVRIDSIGSPCLYASLYNTETHIATPQSIIVQIGRRDRWIVKGDGLDKSLKIAGTIIDGKVRCRMMKAEEEFWFEPIIFDLAEYRSQYLYPTYEVKEERDVRYAHAEGYWTSYPDEDKPFAQIYFARIDQLLEKKDLDLFMDIYEPEGESEQRRPLIMLIHGGSFYNGDKADEAYRLWCKHFASMGYVAASINYRMGWSPSSKNIDAAGYRAVQDANAALRYLVHYADRYRINTDWIFVGGSSAGAITALNAAFLNDFNRPASVMDEGSISKLAPELEESFHISAIVNMWGAVCDTSILNNAHTSIISFHGDSDKIIPYGYGYPFVSQISNASGASSRRKSERFIGRLMSAIIPGQEDAGFWDGIISPMYGSSCIDEYFKAHGYRSELHTVVGGGHSMHVDKHRRIAPYFYTIQDSSAMFLYEEMVKRPIDFRRTDINRYSIDGSEVSEVHWQAEGGVVMESGTDWARMLFFADSPIHKSIVTGIYDSGIEFKEEMVVE